MYALHLYFLHKLIWSFVQYSNIKAPYYSDPQLFIHSIWEKQLSCLGIYWMEQSVYLSKFTKYGKFEFGYFILICIVWLFKLYQMLGNIYIKHMYYLVITRVLMVIINGSTNVHVYECMMLINLYVLHIIINFYQCSSAKQHSPGIIQTCTITHNKYYSDWFSAYLPCTHWSLTQGPKLFTHFIPKLFVSRITLVPLQTSDFWVLTFNISRNKSW